MFKLGKTDNGSAWKSVLLMTGDSRSGKVFADTMAIVAMNDGTRKVKAAFLPTEMTVSIPGYAKAALGTAVGLGGAELALHTVNDCFAAKADKFALVDMDGIAALIDLIDGVKLTLSEQERCHVNRLVAADRLPEDASGSIQVNGQQAAAYTRSSELAPDSEKLNRQKRLVAAILRKVKGELGASAIVKLIKPALKCVKTNYNVLELAELAPVALKLDASSLQTLSLGADADTETLRQQYQVFLND